MKRILVIWLLQCNCIDMACIEWTKLVSVCLIMALVNPVYNPVYNCQKCSYIARRFKTLLKHYSLVHALERDFQVTCGIDDCSNRYKNIRSYQLHIKKAHKHFYADHLSRNNRASENDIDYTAEVDSDYSSHDHDGGSDALQVNAGPDAQRVVPHFDYHKRLACFLLTLRENHKVSLAACTAVANEMDNIVQINSDQMTVKIKQIFQCGGALDTNVTQLIDDIHFQNVQLVTDACGEMSSPHQLQQYVRQHMTFVAPEQVEVGVGNNGKSHTIQYVPIIKTLQALLQHEDILAEVLQDRRSRDGILRDFCDGDQYNLNPLFREHPNALRIELYYDDFTAANAAGTKSRLYKISAVYFILGNLSPKHRSKLDHIQLVSLCLHHEVLANHGIHAMFQPIIRDIVILETDGIEIDCGGQKHHFYGTISFVAADNLGAHSIGRFYENFSTVQRMCRFCTATKTEMQGEFTDDKFQYRSKTSHNAQATAVENDPTLIRAYGVKGQSPLNSLKYYHIIGGLPSDIAHDCFEGIVPETVLLVLQQLVLADLFSFQQLNDMIQRFKFSTLDISNKPPPIFISQGTPRMKYTQSQMWCLLRFLPLIIGHLVPEGNKYWQIILELMDMIETILAPAFHRGDIPFMKDAIEIFHTNFKACFPETNTKPKSHYTTHYPKQTCMFGPLVHCWTIRLEGKHAFFKSIFHGTQNKKNICKSMSERHQTRQALLHSTPLFLGSEEASTFGQATKQICQLPRALQDMLERHFHNTTGNLTTFRKIVLNGVTYCTKTCVLLGAHDGSYGFGLITHIFLVNGEYHFVCKRTTSNYQRHYHAYKLNETSQTCLVTIPDLLDIVPLGLYDIEDAKYVVLKYYIPFI